MAVFGALFLLARASIPTDIIGNAGHDPSKITTSTVSLATDVDNVDRIFEKKMQLQLVISTLLEWTDATLAYSGMTLSSSNDYYQGYRVDMSAVIDQFWTPSVRTTNLIDTENIQRSAFLYPNGRVVYTSKDQITIGCIFDYSNLPRDSHKCTFFRYVDAPAQSVVTIQIYSGSSTTSSTGYIVQSQNLFNHIFELSMKSAEVTTATVEDGQNAYNGVLYTMELRREPGFFWIFYIVPSILFVMLSYSSYWIDKNAVPARVALGVISILITLNMMNSTHKYIPQINYATWLGTFLNGTLLFTVVSMLEYATLNFCSTNYAEMRKAIDAAIANMSGTKVEKGGMKVLQDQRKNIQNQPKEEAKR